MVDSDDYFDDLINDEEEDSDEFDEDDDDSDDEEDDESAEVRTAILSKNEMLALIGLKTSDEGGLIVRVDPRETKPAAQTYDDAEAATKWFNRSLASSRRNGWRVLYDGDPLYG